MKMCEYVPVCARAYKLYMEGTQLATETEKRCEEKWLRCCASWGYSTPTGPYSNLHLNLSPHLRRGEGFEEGQCTDVCVAETKRHIKTLHVEKHLHVFLPYLPKR